MNLPVRLILAVLSSWPITCGRFVPVNTQHSEVLSLNTVYQKTSHGTATFDTQNHWIKFESVTDGIDLTVDVHQASNMDDGLGLPQIISSLTYYLDSAGDSISRAMPVTNRKGTTVCLETYDRAFLHYCYVFSY